MHQIIVKLLGYRAK